MRTKSVAKAVTGDVKHEKPPPSDCFSGANCSSKLRQGGLSGPRSFRNTFSGVRRAGGAPLSLGVGFARLPRGIRHRSWRGPDANRSPVPQWIGMILCTPTPSPVAGGASDSMLAAVQARMSHTLCFPLTRSS
jgi:hypothetical protein